MGEGGGGNQGKLQEEMAWSLSMSNIWQVETEGGRWHVKLKEQHEQNPESRSMIQVWGALSSIKHQKDGVDGPKSWGPDCGWQCIICPGIYLEIM